MAKPFNPFSRARVSIFKKRLIKYSLLIVIIFATAYAIIRPYKNNEVYVVSPPPSYSEINTDSLLKLVSEWRISQKLQPIIKNALLCDSATIRAVEVHKNWSHEGFLPKRVCRERDCEIGENLAKDATSAQEILSLWLQSSAHRDVLDFPSYKYGCAVQIDQYVVLHLSDVNLKY